MLVGEEDAGLRITVRLDGWRYHMLGAEEFVGEVVKFYLEMLRVRLCGGDGWSAGGHTSWSLREREVRFESQQNNEAMGVGEVTQGECKREKRREPKGAKTCKGHIGEGEAIQEQGTGRQGEQKSQQDKASWQKGTRCETEGVPTGFAAGRALRCC